MPRYIFEKMLKTINQAYMLEIIIINSLIDDEIVDKFKFSRQRRWMENAHIDMPQDIADSISESNIPAEPHKTLIAFLVMVSYQSYLIVFLRLKVKKFF